MEAESPHRLFRAMVLMGGSLALACGGVTSNPQEGSGSSANGSSAGNTGGSGSAEPSNQPSVPSAGAGSGTGGGTAGGNGPGKVAPPITGLPPSNLCPPPQWDCSSSLELSCPDGISFALPHDCSCDFARPLNAADCSPGERLACHWAGFTQAGESLESATSFDCKCVLPAADCRATCGRAFPSLDGRCEDAAPDADVLCGCALVLLK